MFSFRTGGGWLAAVAWMAFAGAAQAQDFYKGKTLTLVIASNAGGGTDTTARLVARHWAKHIPGNPEIVIRNKPVGVIAANDLTHATRADGLTVGAFAGAGTIGPVSRKASAVKYDPLQWGMIGSIERGASLLLVRKSAMDRLHDRKAKPLVIGSVSSDRTQDAIALFGSEWLGWNLKFVMGYPSSNEIYLAFERGEIDIFGSGTTKIINRFRDSGAAVAIVAEAPRRDFPDVPLFERMLGDKKPGGVEWQAFRAWAGSSAVDKFFAAPPRTPDNLVRILQTSFLALADDPQFAAEAETTLGDAFLVKSGDDTHADIRDGLVRDPAVAERMNVLRKKYGLPLVADLK